MNAILDKLIAAFIQWIIIPVTSIVVFCLNKGKICSSLSTFSILSVPCPAAVPHSYLSYAAHWMQPSYPYNTQAFVMTLTLA